MKSAFVKDILDHAKLTDRHKQEQSVKQQKNNSNTNSLNIEEHFEFWTKPYNWFLSNAQSLVLLAIVVIGLYLGFKREFSKLIGF